MSEKFAVLLADPESYDPMAVAKALAAIRGVPLQDAIAPARAAGGLLLENADEKAARDLAARFDRAGFPSVVVLQEKVLPLPPVQGVSSLTFLPDGVEVVLEASRKVAASQTRVRLISAGAFKQTTLETITVKEGPTQGQKMASLGILMTTGLPIHIGGKEKTTEKTVENSDFVFYVDLILKAPFERARVDGRKINYSCLKEKMGYSVIGNFPLLVRELISVAPGARLNRGARVIARSGPMREATYDSLEEMDRESRWLLALANG